MSELMEPEEILRLLLFFLVFAVMAVWELFAPRRTLTVSRGQRWFSNLSIVIANTLLIRIVFPVSAIQLAMVSHDYGWGVFNILAFPAIMEIIICVVALDFIIYLQHILFHAVPVLWRLHRVHHADLDFDVTTGTRFHPIEIVISMLIKFAAIILLGPAPVAVLIFEIVLNSGAMFNHSNVKLPLLLDKLLRALIVTPDMHRVHHSVIENEANSNYGFNLSIWDRLFGTYINQPAAGHENMNIGISTFRQVHECDHLYYMLKMPFVGKVSAYAINRRSWKGETGEEKDRS
jgi:sterol desaturase/sphingolipid hydroxylase (fatty acid hydroxylase superfamily)